MERHIVFTNGRSGSNYISGLINHHPNLTNYGEVLGEWTIPYRLYENFFAGRTTTEAYLDYIYSSSSFFYLSQTYSAIAHIRKSKKINFKNLNSVKSLGIKDFSMNFIRRDLRNYLRDRPDIKVISLYRENHLERYISYLNLKQSGVVSVEKNQAKRVPTKDLKVRVSPDEMLSDLERIEKETEDQLEIVRDLSPERVYEIRYEELFSSKEKSSSIQLGMFDFLGVEPLDIQGSSKKILTKKMPEIIENYDEFLSQIRNTRYEKFVVD
jgi:hypothetical protein